MERVQCPPETAFHFYKYVIGNTSQVHNWLIKASHLTNFFCSLIVFFLCTDFPLSNVSTLQESISSHMAPVLWPTALAEFPVKPDWKTWLESPLKYVPPEEAYLINVCNWWEHQQFLFVSVNGTEGKVLASLVQLLSSIFILPQTLVWSRINIFK